MSKKTYGECPGVTVHLDEGDVSPKPKLPDLSERELRLCLICIQATRALWLDDGKMRFDLVEACHAMKVYGYSHYDSRPMLQAALRELGERVEEGRVDIS